MLSSDVGESERVWFAYWGEEGAQWFRDDPPLRYQLVCHPLGHLILGSQSESEGTFSEKWLPLTCRVWSKSVVSGFSPNVCVPFFPGCLTLISQSEMSNS